MFDKLYYVIGATVAGGIILLAIGFTLFAAGSFVYHRFINTDVFRYYTGRTYPSKFLNECYGNFNTNYKTKGDRSTVYKYLLKYRLRNIRRTKR